MKRGTHMQVPNTGTPAKFQAHPIIKTPSTSHLVMLKVLGPKCNLITRLNHS